MCSTGGTWKFCSKLDISKNEKVHLLPKWGRKPKNWILMVLWQYLLGIQNKQTFLRRKNMSYRMKQLKLPLSKPISDHLTLRSYTAQTNKAVWLRFSELKLGWTKIFLPQSLSNSDKKKEVLNKNEKVRISTFHMLIPD